MKILKKLSFVMLIGLLLFVSCTDEVPMNDKPTRGTLVVDVGRYEGATDYLVMVGDKQVDIVDGKASIDLDFASYDVYVAAMKENVLLAESLESVDFKESGSFKATLEEIKATRYFSNVKFDTTEKINPNVTETVIALMPDEGKTYTKTVVGLEFVFNSVTPSPGEMAKSLGVSPDPSDPVIEPQPIIFAEKGTYAWEGENLTLTPISLGEGPVPPVTKYTMKGNKLTSATESYSELNGDAGGQISGGHYWSLPQIAIPAETLNPLLAMFSQEVNAEFGSELKALAALKNDLLVDIGFRFYKGNVDVYMDVTVDEVDYFDAKISTLGIVKEGVRISLPVNYNEKAGVVVMNMDLPDGMRMPISFKREPGGSMMALTISIPAGPNPGDIMNIAIPFVRGAVDTEIYGSPFSSDKYIDLEKTLAQVKTFVQNAEIEDSFKKVATPFVTINPEDKTSKYSVLGNWICDDKNFTELNVTVGYGDMIVGKGNELVTAVSVCEWADMNGGSELKMVYRNNAGTFTHIFIKPNSFKYQMDDVNKTIDSVTATITVVEGDVTKHTDKECTFKRTDLSPDQDDVYVWLDKAEKEILKTKENICFTKQGRIRVSVLNDSTNLPIRYKVDNDKIYFYSSLHDVIDTVVPNIPGNNINYPEVDISGYMMMPYVKCEPDGIAFLKDATKKNYGLILKDTP